MLNISFLGDVMLGRFVAEQYSLKPYSLISDDVVTELLKSDVRIANLESPITSIESEDSLKFSAKQELLEHFKWVNCFSLSNNHINDFGVRGMTETIADLNSNGIVHNGLYIEEYTPFFIERNGERVAVITCTDMMNSELSDDCPYKTLRVNRPEKIIQEIKRCKQDNYFVILYAHVGMLFTRFPNPVIRDFVHRMIDSGADCVVTVHPHCLGGAELYNNKLIVYSLGDFLMDGASYRRRKAGVLKISISNGEITEWSILPVVTDNNLMVRNPDLKTRDKILKSFNQVSRKIDRHASKYLTFYKRQYKIELVQHAISTIHFEFNRRGLWGLIKILSKRGGAVRGMTKRVMTDRSAMSYDSDAVNEKNISVKDIR